jgi:hypothetical protein
VGHSGIVWMTVGLLVCSGQDPTCLLALPAFQRHSKAGLAKGQPSRVCAAAMLRCQGCAGLRLGRAQAAAQAPRTACIDVLNVELTAGLDVQQPIDHPKVKVGQRTRCRAQGGRKEAV